jgi:outer membrane lipopolysaccharide assembly protein LptE/RlpB
MTENQVKIAETLFENAGRLAYGTASLSLKVHSGRIVDIIHTVTESTREKETSLFSDVICELSKPQKAIQSSTRYRQR